MTEKDNDSMATVQIKPDYAASEVYSTASEAPPAYKRQANSVKIAKITALTVITSSFILGSFILASSYLQAKASCDQVQALDSVLEKELMLETLQQVNKEYPRAEALVGKENTNSEIDLQNIEKETTKKEKGKEQQAPPSAVNSESDSSFSDSEEAEDLQKIPNKVPLELDLSDLAAALLQNNQKSRMNCVVERKRAEEILDSPSKIVALPFGMNLTTDPKKARVTGERISIFCEGGNENKEQQQGNQGNRESDDDDDDAEEIPENIRPMFFPIPFGRTPNQSPLTHMPHRMPLPFQQPIRPPMPQQMMEAPQPQYQPQQQTVRIHVQEIPYRAIHMADDVPVQIPAGRQEAPHYHVQKLPLDVALYRAGITSEDLRNIQHMAEERITDELRRLAAEEAEAVETSNDSENGNSVEDESAHSSSVEQEKQQQPRQQQIQMLVPREQQQGEQPVPRHVILQHQQLPEQPRDTMVPPMPDQPEPMMHFGRAAYGRSLIQPVSIPVPMMQSRPEISDEASESERPANHYVQPRSIRSTDNLFQPESKRVKKCACDCNC